MQASREITPHNGAQPVRNGVEAGANAPLRRMRPAADVYENDEEVLVVADLPGVEADAVSVDLDGNQLHIQARQLPHGAAGGTADASEDRSEAVLLQRSFVIPSSIDANEISAKLEDGVLHVHMKKRAAARARRIDVRTN